MKLPIACLLVPLAACASLDRSFGPACEGKCDAPEDSCQAFMECVVAGERAIGACASALASPGGTPCETKEELADRHTEIADRRAAQPFFFIAHRGSWAYHAENSLEAFHTTASMGGDANEIDIRRTSDGVLVTFHDDLLQGAMVDIGDVRDRTFAELTATPPRVRQPYHLCEQRVPTFVEVLDRHRRDRSFIGLDIKDAAATDDVIALVDALDMWDHAFFSSSEELAAERPVRGFGVPGINGGYGQRLDMAFDAIADRTATMDRGELWVEDPAAGLLATDRLAGDESPCLDSPLAAFYSPVIEPPGLIDGSAEELCSDFDRSGMEEVAASEELDAAAFAGATTARALLARTIAHRSELHTEACMDLLAEIALAGGLHRSWRHHRVDATEAIFALAEIDEERLTEVAEEIVHRIDPRLAPIANASEFHDASDLALIDWRTKSLVWQALLMSDGDQGARIAALADSVLALEPAERRRIGATDSEMLVETALWRDGTPERYRRYASSTDSKIAGRAIWTLAARVRSGGDAELRALLEELAPWRPELAR